MLVIEHVICFNIGMDTFDHSGSLSHLLLPRARVGFSAYLQHIVSKGWPTGSLETLGVYQLIESLTHYVDPL